MSPLLAALAALPVEDDETPIGWAAEALCAQTDPEAFFPEKGGSSRAAKRVCAECPVRLDCLDDAIERNEPYGVWGGMSRKERIDEARARGLVVEDDDLPTEAEEAA